MCWNTPDRNLSWKSNGKFTYKVDCKKPITFGVDLFWLP